MSSSCEVFFTVSDVPEVEALVVTGSAAELGCWDPAGALQLQRNEDGTWSGKASVTGDEAIIPIEYKYVLHMAGCSPQWEDGNNRIAAVPDGKLMTVAESLGNRDSEKDTVDIVSSSEENTPDGSGPAMAEDEPVCPPADEEPAQEDVPQEEEPCAEDQQAAPEPYAEEEEAVAASPGQSSPQVVLNTAEGGESVADCDGDKITEPAPEAGGQDAVNGDSANEQQQEQLPSPQQQPDNEPTATIAVAAAPPPKLDLSQPRPRARRGSDKISITVSSERALLWVFPPNKPPIEETHSQLFHADQTHYSQMALEHIAGGLRPFVIASLSSPKTMLNFVEGPKGSRLRVEAFTNAKPDPFTTHPAVLLKYLHKEKSQFLKEAFIQEAHQRLLHASYGLTAVSSDKPAQQNGSLLSPRSNPLSPVAPRTPQLNVLPSDLITPDIAGTADILEDAMTLLKHLSEICKFRNGATVPDDAQKALECALSNMVNIMKVRDSLDQNSRRLEDLEEMPVEQRRVYAKDLLDQCAAQLDRDDVLEAVIDGLACRVLTR